MRQATQLPATVPIMDLTTRPLTLADAEQILEILVEAEHLEPADQHFDLDEVIEELTGPETDLERGTVGLFDGDRLVAYGRLVILVSEEGWKAYAMGGVRSDVVGTGLGARIIDHLAEQARVLRDSDHPGLPGDLRLWIPGRRQRFARLGAKLGFEIRRWFQDMQHPLTDLPPRTGLPADVRLQTWDGRLSEQVRIASNESFADHFGSSPQSPELWASSIDSTNFRPEVSVLAVDDQGVVGFVLVEEYPAEAAARGFRVGYLSRVGTVARGRGRGVASALLTDTLYRLREAGYGVAELSVDSESPTGAGRLYERIGFHPTHLSTQNGRRF